MSKHSTDLQIFKYCLLLFSGWKIVLTLISYFGLVFLPVSLPELHIGMAEVNTDYWIRWANWDGGHFRGIAENGYLHSFQVVFFPLYPALINSLMFFQIPSLWGGIIISNLAILGALYFLYKLVRLDFDETISKRVLFLTLAFPTAFYFNAVYSESLFLFLTVSAFFFARTKNWGISFALASLSAITRLTGLVVILAIGLEYFLKTEKLPDYKQIWANFLNRIAVYIIAGSIITTLLKGVFIDNRFYLVGGLSRTISAFLAVMALILIGVNLIKYFFESIDFRRILKLPSFYLVISVLPFLSFCWFLYLTQGNFFAFVGHEKQWDRHLSLPWDAFINYSRDLINARVFKIEIITAQKLIEFLFFVFYFLTLIYCYFKLRLSYTVYFALSLLIPITTGTLQAIHRYGLVIFPVFILLALIKNETFQNLWVYFSLSLLGILTVMFINSYWVT